jgi:hypothetical protein
MNGRLVAVLVLGMCLGWSVGARAQGLSFRGWQLSVTESLYVNYNETLSVNNQLHDFAFVDVKNRLNLQLTSRWLDTGVRLDGAWFVGVSDDPQLDEAFRSKYADHLTAEKFWLAVRRRDYSLELGDFYATFGKGIALSVQKVDELGMDTTLRGGKAVIRSDLVTGTVLAGYSNVVNVGDLIMEKLDDPNDLVVGVEAKVKPARWLEVSAHTSWFRFSTNWREVASSGDHARQDLTLVGGLVSIPGLADILSVEVEYNYQMNHEMVYGMVPEEWLLTYNEESGDGHALYTMVAAHHGVFHFLGEGKFYKGFKGTGLVGKDLQSASGTPEVAYYGSLPPLEDPDLFLRAGYYDQWGFHTRVDAEIPGSGTILFAAYSHTDELDVQDLGPDLDNASRVRHVYGGAEQRVDRWSLSGKLFGGYRKDKEGLGADYTMFHTDAEVQFPMWGAHSMEMHGRMERYENALAFGSKEFTVAKGTASYTFAPHVSLSFNYEFSDKADEKSLSGKEHFLSGEAAWRFLPGSYLKLFAGATRGGLKCAGGMCRKFPPFEGVKGEVTVRF